MKDVCAVGQVRDLSKLMDKYIAERIKEDNLPILMNHIKLFYILTDETEPVSFNQIMKTWGISKSSLSDIINKYEKMGIVSKIASDSDRRTIYIKGSEEVKRIRERLDFFEDELMDNLLGNLEAEEREIFEKVLSNALLNANK